MGALGTWDLADELQARPDARRTTTIATVSRVDDDGSVWVRLPGADADTPVNGRMYVDAKPGQTVQATIEGGRCSITGNASSPAVGGGYVRQVIAPVEQKATNALDEAQRAHNAADAAEKDADRARVAAESAEGSASDAAIAATAAQGSASTAASSASAAQSSAAQASSAASQAQADASTAATAAGNAATSAASASNSASQAASDAASANRSANNALVQLSVVEDVAGTLSWIREHATLVSTQDTSPQDGVAYFAWNDRLGDYMPVGAPDADANPSVLGWKVLAVDKAQADYVMAHLAVTSRGLWVLPEGRDVRVDADVEGSDGEAVVGSDGSVLASSTTEPEYASGYKLLLAADGMYLYDGSGRAVATYGESIGFDSDRPQYIGGEDAYIVYYDTDNDGHPDSILIGGSNVTIDAPTRIVAGGETKTLSQVLSEVAQASQAAEDALDSATLSITSTHGQLFKNGTESTVLQVAVFPNGGDRLDTIAQVRERFGAGSYIEWQCRQEGGAWVTLPNNDNHISQGGMWLTVTPGDVDIKTTFAAALVTP